MKFKYQTIRVDEDLYQAIIAQRDHEHPTIISVLRKIFGLPGPPLRTRKIRPTGRRVGIHINPKIKPGKYTKIGSLLVPVDPWTPPRKWERRKPEPEPKRPRGRPNRVWLQILKARGEIE